MYSMKLKYYMRGLGIGIIITALIMSFGTPKEKLTDKEIIKRAEALGMVMKEETNKNLDAVLEGLRPSKGPDSQAGEEVTEDPQATPVEEPSVTPGTEATQAPAKEAGQEDTTGQVETVEQADETIQDQTADQADEVKASPEKLETTNQGSREITFTIEAGMSSRQIARLLESIGLIKSATDFNDYILGKGKTGVIRTGTYTVPEEVSYSELLKIITTAQ